MLLYVEKFLYIEKCKRTFNLCCVYKTTHLETCHLQTCHLQPSQCKHVPMVQIVRKFRRLKHIHDAIVLLHWRQSIVKMLHFYICISVFIYLYSFCKEIKSCIKNICILKTFTNHFTFSEKSWLYSTDLLDKVTL